MKTKAQIGDVFEIDTSLGLCYAQYTHKHPTYTDVLRIFDKKYIDRPSDFEEVAKDKVGFTVLCAVNASYQGGSIEKVASASIREDLRDFPKFRNGSVDPETMEESDWWIWDGQNETIVGKLTDEQRGYPLLAIRNISAIVALIEGRVHPSLL